MKYSLSRTLAILCIALSPIFSFAIPPHQQYRFSYENVLGTSFDLKLSAVSEERSNYAETEAFKEIDRLSAILSSYNPNSEFSQWQKTNNRAVKVSTELFEVFTLFNQWQAKTAGALNPAVASVINLWKQADQTQQLPSADQLQQAVAEVQQAHWTLNAANQTATHLTQTPLVFNTFVKSYIINKVADRLMSIDGISAVLVNIGGDIVTKGKEIEQIYIVDPKRLQLSSTLEVENKAIATSGNYMRGFSINGKWYSHIIDPKTGMPVSEIISATVIAKDAINAGALATAFNVMSIEKAIELAKQEGVEYQIIAKNGQHFESDGWKAMEVKTSAIAPTKEGNWNKSNEVAISLELKRFEGRSHRPFVAIWIEDGQKNTVRNLALWYNKPRWLPDLKEWHHKNGSGYQNGGKEIGSISSATRPAGSYTLVWDGKNDAGEFVNTGEYTIYIEVAREHGTYQLMKQTVNCKHKEAQFTLPGNEEVVSASVEYRKISK